METIIRKLLFNLGVIISLLMFGATLVVWLSTWTGRPLQNRAVPIWDEPGSSNGFYTYRSGIVFERYEHLPLPWQKIHLNVDMSRLDQVLIGLPKSHNAEFLGFAFYCNRPMLPLATDAKSAPMYQVYAANETIMMFPVWFLLIATSILPLLALRKWRRNRRTVQNGFPVIVAGDI